jgi:glyoxylase-like metal-dependent hydrolase (beta-lactamase superfamily II)
MKEIFPGIFQIKLTLSGFSPDYVNVYLIRIKNGYLIVDTGWDSPPALQFLQTQMGEIGAQLSDIKQIVITHCHIDHLGMIPRFKKYNNPQIYIHQNELDLIKIRFRGGDNFLPLTDKFLKIHGVPESELAPPEVQLPIPDGLALIEPDILLKGGEEILAGQYKLKVINTPGHTPGHLVLYEPDKKFIISGDMLLPTIATNAALHAQHIQNPLRKYIDSLMLLQRMDIQLVLPGHEYAYSNPGQRIKDLLQHHQQKAFEIFQAFADRLPKSAYDVSRILSWSPQNNTTNWNNLTGWDKRFAVLQAIAHLEELVFSKKLIKNVKNGKVYYR